MQSREAKRWLGYYILWAIALVVIIAQAGCVQVDQLETWIYDTPQTDNTQLWAASKGLQAEAVADSLIRESSIVTVEGNEDYMTEIFDYIRYIVEVFINWMIDSAA